MKKIYWLIILVMFLPLFNVSATEKTTEVYIFTQQGCPHCANALALLDEMKSSDYPEIVVDEFDMKVQPKYVKKYQEFATAYNINPTGVPVLYIGPKTIIGFQETEIRQALESCHLPISNCINPNDYVAEQLKSLPAIPNSTNPNSPQAMVGWVVLGILVVGGGIVIVNKFF
ncbi:MAG: glutaredoxin domain-containing protein [Patescibacteria group bacterium]